MSEIRARVDDIVQDPATARALKAWYRQLCKRPVLPRRVPARPSTCPTSTWSTPTAQGVERITPAGVVAAGVEYPVDCIIYASGFEVGTEPTGAYGFDMTGRDGVKLSDYWSDGMRTLHGIHVARLPELPSSSSSARAATSWPTCPHNLTDTAKTVARRRLPHG